MSGRKDSARSALARVPHLHPIHVEDILAELGREGLLDEPRSGNGGPIARVTTRAGNASAARGQKVGCEWFMLERSNGTGRLSQQNLIAIWRSESVFDRAIPLGYPSNNDRVEVGLPASVWFRRKHGRGGPSPGKYWPSHLLSGWDDRAT
jgi:hypothetical protein